VIIMGLAITGVAQAFAPASHPLFDGVVVVEPYRFLEPASGQEGSPLSANETVPMTDGTSPAFAVYTGESPPQAELLARGGELSTGSAAKSVKVAIMPIAPPAGSHDGVAGNVYRVTVTDDSGTGLALVPGETVTLALRGPDGINGNATIAHFADGSWNALPTSPSGLQGLFLSNVGSFGDFAVLGKVPETPSDMSPGLLIAALIAAGVIGFLGLRLARRSGPAGPGSHPSRRRPARGVRR
jgi:hypothetical protein